MATGIIDGNGGDGVAAAALRQAGLAVYTEETGPAWLAALPKEEAK